MMDTAGADIGYRIRRSVRARRLRIVVYRDGAVVVVLPRGTSVATAERFVRDKASWIRKNRERFRREPRDVAPGGGHGDFLRHRESARVLAHARIAHFNGIYGLRFSAITIKNQRTLWGSCSRGGNLNFNYKIALLPPPLADYIIVHELCHLAAFDHSKKFWALVSRAIPDYAARRRALRRTGAGLS
jgi:predicted metal-dependent hydrolase